MGSERPSPSLPPPPSPLPSSPSPQVRCTHQSRSRSSMSARMARIWTLNSSKRVMSSFSARAADTWIYSVKSDSFGSSRMMISRRPHALQIIQFELQVAQPPRLHRIPNIFKKNHYICVRAQSKMRLSNFSSISHCHTESLACLLSRVDYDTTKFVYHTPLRCVNVFAHLVADDLQALENGRFQRVGAVSQPHLHGQYLLPVCFQIQSLQKVNSRSVLEWQ